MVWYGLHFDLCLCFFLKEKCGFFLISSCILGNFQLIKENSFICLVTQLHCSKRSFIIQFICFGTCNIYVFPTFCFPLIRPMSAMAIHLLPGLICPLPQVIHKTPIHILPRPPSYKEATKNFPILLNLNSFQQTQTCRIQVIPLSPGTTWFQSHSRQKGKETTTDFLRLPYKSIDILKEFLISGQFFTNC